MSENLAYLHQNTSSHIKLQHDFNYYKEKSQTEKKLSLNFKKFGSFIANFEFLA